ncbi:MAG: SulP family inorganic anion transporter [Phycisphaerae bacterium]|nr:SulP family inorganic anion transporter [Gemmatimonadaceae bacterium]
MPNRESMFSYPRQDLVAGSVVFLVALPLCLGIAIACGVPPISGLIAGIAGGLIVPWISRSALSVTGPAAGLTSVVLAEVANLGTLELFLAAVMAAGIIQFILGVLRTGRFTALVPSAVIKGMLAAIGITIVLKQLPVAFGVTGGISAIATSLSLGAVLIAAVSLAILFGWSHTPMAKYSMISPALIVVLVATGMAMAFASIPSLALDPTHYVSVPLGSFSDLAAAVPRPELAGLMQPKVWMVGMTIAVVASIETLLSLQAIDRLDPLKRKSPPDRELLAQGVANLASGFIGGLPVTAVIVRSGVNLAAGGRQRLSAFFHGLLLVVAVLFFGALINRIPLAALAAVLIQVGLKLSSPALFRTQYKLGWNQFLPFIITITAIMFTDLLQGVIIGIIVGVFFVLRQNSRDTIERTETNEGLILRFRRDATFISKPALITMLNEVQNDQHLVIDGTGEFVDHDTKEVLAGFVADAPSRGISVSLRGLDLSAAGPGGGH